MAAVTAAFVLFLQKIKKFQLIYLLFFIKNDMLIIPIKLNFVFKEKLNFSNLHLESTVCMSSVI